MNHEQSPIELTDDELSKVSGGARMQYWGEYYVNPDLCICCENCGKNCPADCISFDGETAAIDQEICIQCGSCRDACPTGAIMQK